jgi:hypothetical protein
MLPQIPYLPDTVSRRWQVQITERWIEKWLLRFSSLSGRVVIVAYRAMSTRTWLVISFRQEITEMPELLQQFIECHDKDIVQSASKELE